MGQSLMTRAKKFSPTIPPDAGTVEQSSFVNDPSLSAMANDPNLDVGGRDSSQLQRNQVAQAATAAGGTPADAEGLADSSISPAGLAADTPITSNIRLNWDESAAEVLINGRRIDDCPREIIRRTGMDEASFKRAAFIYTQAMRNVPYETIGTEILTTDPDWKAITSVSGVRAAARRFATKFGLPRPPLRHYYRR